MDFTFSDAVFGAGEKVPFARFTGVAGFFFVTSFLHLDTISLASRATSGFLCCLDLLTTTPIFVDLRRSSVAATPVFKSFRILRMFAGGSPAEVAFCSALDFAFTSCNSMALFNNSYQDGRTVSVVGVHASNHRIEWPLLSCSVTRMPN